MIQPIQQNLSVYNNRRISFKNISNESITYEKQGDTENYLKALVEEKQEQNRLIKEFHKGTFLMSLANIIMLYINLFFIGRNGQAGKLRKPSKLPDNSINVAISFSSLLSDKKVPTLNSCKSLSNNLQTVLKQQVAQLGASRNIAQLAGMPEMTNRLILVGPPGSGKSFFAKVMAKSLNAKYMEVQASDFISKWAGEGTQNLKNIFEKIIKEAEKAPDEKFVVTFNEIDTIIQPVEKISNAGNAGGTHFMTKLEHRSTFLNYIDQISAKNPNVIIIGTSNLSPKNKALDGAAMSRFQNIVEVSLPEKECLLEAIKSNLAGIKEYEKFISTNDKELIALAKEMEAKKYSFRDLENIIMSSKKYYLEDLLKDKNKDYSIEYLKKGMDSKTITDGDIIM